MFHNVIDFELMVDHPTVCAGIPCCYEHPFTFTLPPIPVIPASHVTVGALLFFHPGMRRTAPFGHQHAAPRLRAELHTYAISTITMPYCASTNFFRSL